MSKSKQQFQTAVEKIKKSEEDLEKLRKTNEIEKDSIVHKLSHCNLELQKKLKKIDPSYEVRKFMYHISYFMQCSYECMLSYEHS